MKHPKKMAARHTTKHGATETGFGSKPSRGSSRPQMGGKKAKTVDAHGGDMHTLGRLGAFSGRG